MPLFSTAFAADVDPNAAPAGLFGGSGAFESMLPLILIFVIFYFMLIRPQQKRMKEHQSMLTRLKRGDSVITGGGIIGTVHKVEEKENIVIVEIAPDVRVKISRTTITSVLNADAKRAAKNVDAESEESTESDSSEKPARKKKKAE